MKNPYPTILKLRTNQIQSSEGEKLPQIHWNTTFIDSKFNINNVEIVNKQVKLIKQEIKEQENKIKKLQSNKSISQKQKLGKSNKYSDITRKDLHNSANKAPLQHQSQSQIEPESKIKQSANLGELVNWKTQSSPDFADKQIKNINKNTEKKAKKTRTQPYRNTSISSPQNRAQCHPKIIQQHPIKNFYQQIELIPYEFQEQSDLYPQIKNLSPKVQPFAEFIKKKSKNSNDNELKINHKKNESKPHQNTSTNKKNESHSKNQIKHLNKKILLMQHKLDQLCLKQTHLQNQQLPKPQILNNQNTNQPKTNDQPSSKFQQQISTHIAPPLQSNINKNKNKFFNSSQNTEENNNNNNNAMAIQKIQKQENKMNKRQMMEEIKKLRAIIDQLQIQKTNHQKIIAQLEIKNSLEHQINLISHESNKKQYHSSKDTGKIVQKNSKGDDKNIENSVKWEQASPIKIDQKSNLIFNINDLKKEINLQKSKNSKQINNSVYNNSNQNLNKATISFSLKKRGLIAREIINKQDDQTAKTKNQSNSKQISWNALFDQQLTSSGKMIYQLQFIKQSQSIQETLQLLRQKVSKMKIESLKIPNIPKAPTSKLSQNQLLTLAKQLCTIFRINIKPIQNITIKKYKNCVIFQLPQLNQSVVWYYSGKLYIGDWQQNQQGEGKKIGNGCEYNPGKYYYEGQFLAGKRNGSGTMVLTNGNIYRGQWQNGQKHGHGCYFQQKFGTIYEGEWKQDSKEGKGILKISQNQFYEGLFVNSIKHGYGCEFFINGDFYRGEYHEGKFHGNGKYVWKNGAMYEGEFINGQRNGIGKWKSCRDEYDLFVGEYKNDQKSGRGKYLWSNGCVYDGYFNNDQKDGEGRVVYQDGREVRGFWEKGKLAKVYAVIQETKIQDSANQENSWMKKEKKTL